MAQDYIALLGEGGKARQYFKDATGGAPWVDGMCNEIVAQLKTNVRYIANNKDVLQNLITDAASMQQCKGFTCFRTAEGGWQASYAVGDISTWAITIAPTINEAFSTMLANAIGRFE